jgi:hypothetical protein
MATDPWQAASDAYLAAHPAPNAFDFASPDAKHNQSNPAASPTAPSRHASTSVDKTAVPVRSCAGSVRQVTLQTPPSMPRRPRYERHAQPAPHRGSPEPRPTHEPRRTGALSPKHTLEAVSSSGTQRWEGREVAIGVHDRIATECWNNGCSCTECRRWHRDAERARAEHEPRRGYPPTAASHSVRCSVSLA